MVILNIPYPLFTKKNPFGYTLIEIIVVMSLVVSLSLAAIPHYQTLEIRSNHKRYIGELAIGHSIWLELELKGEEVLDINQLKYEWTFALKQPANVYFELDYTTKSLSIIDNRNNAQSRRCHRFSLSRAGEITITDNNNQKTNTYCSPLE